MALLACKGCGRPVSSEAQACPGCGAPPPKSRSGIGRLGLIFVGFAVGGLIVGAVAANVRDRQMDAEARARAAAESARVAALTPEQRAAEAKAAAERAAGIEERARLASAQYACREFVKRSLHDPDSAEFEDHRTYWAEKRRGGTYVVQVRVRARNAFNALRAGVFECTARRAANGDWSAAKVKQLEH
jgi:hypothetical protein